MSDARTPSRVLSSTRGPLALFILILLTFALDRLAFDHLSLHDPTRLQAIQGKDWYRLLRIAGYWPTWLVVALALALADRRAGRTNWPRRAVFLALSTGAAGLAAELIKGLAGRMRPEDTAGAFRIMPVAYRWAHWSDLSMPSSHAAVAFAGAFAAARLWPGTCLVLLPLAVGCGVTRILAGAHFLSDIAVAAAVGWIAALAVHRLDARNNAGQPIAPPLPRPGEEGAPLL